MLNLAQSLILTKLLYMNDSEMCIAGVFCTTTRQRRSVQKSSWRMQYVLWWWLFRSVATTEPGSVTSGHGYWRSSLPSRMRYIYWQARSGLPISVNWTFFARCYGWGATSEYQLRIGEFAPAGPGWLKISGRRDRPPPTICHHHNYTFVYWKIDKPQFKGNILVVRSKQTLVTWLGHLTRKNPSPIWATMYLVGR